MAIDRRALLSGSAAALTIAPGLSRAAEWPTRPVNVVVPWPAGGSTDILGRLLTKRFSESFGQPFLVDNRTGANGNLGAAQVARSAPNGDTLMFTSNGPLTNSVLLYKNLGFDPMRDFAPIAIVGETSLVFAGSSKLPVSNMKELTDYARQHPGKLNVGNPSIGTVGHLASKLWEFSEGLKITTIPYRGSAPLQNDIMAGVVDVAVDLASSYVQHIKGGAVRGLAVTAGGRIADLPDVSTVAEQGLAYLAVAGWFGLVAPAGTPKAIIDRLGQAALDYANSAEGRSRIAQAGIIPTARGAEAFAHAQVAEIAKWRPVVERAGIRMD